MHMCAALHTWTLTNLLLAWLLSELLLLMPVDPEIELPLLLWWFVDDSEVLDVFFSIWNMEACENRVTIKIVVKFTYHGDVGNGNGSCLSEWISCRPPLFFVFGYDGKNFALFEWQIVRVLSVKIEFGSHRFHFLDGWPYQRRRVQIMHFVKIE